MNDTDIIQGFFDARCKECGKRHGWFGTIADAPTCPRCGYNAFIDPIVAETENAIRDIKCYRRVQEVLHNQEYLMRIGKSEKRFLFNMYRKKKGYTITQRKNILRIFKRFIHDE